MFLNWCFNFRKRGDCSVYHRLYHKKPLHFAHTVNLSVLCEFRVDE